MKVHRRLESCNGVAHLPHSVGDNHLRSQGAEPRVEAVVDEVGEITYNGTVRKDGKNGGSGVLEKASADRVLHDKASGKKDPQARNAQVQWTKTKLIGKTSYSLWRSSVSLRKSVARAEGCASTVPMRYCEKTRLNLLAYVSSIAKCHKKGEQSSALLPSS